MEHILTSCLGICISKKTPTIFQIWDLGGIIISILVYLGVKYWFGILI